MKNIFQLKTQMIYTRLLKIAYVFLFITFGFASVAQEQHDPIHEALLGDETLEIFKRINSSFDIVGNAFQQASVQLENDEEYSARITLKPCYTELGKVKNNLNYLLEKYDESEELAEQLNCTQTKTEVSTSKSHLLASIDYLGFSMEHLSLFIGSGNQSGIRSYITQFNAFEREFGAFSETLVAGFTPCHKKIETKEQTVPTPIVVEQTEKKNENETTTTSSNSYQSEIDLGIYFGKGVDSNIYEAFYIYEGSKAEAAGIKRFDSLIAIDGIAIYQKSEEEVKQLLNGAQGTSVVLTIDRDGTLIDITIIR